MNKEAKKMLEDEFSKKELIKLLNGINKTHIDLVKWLYDNYRGILREYEVTRGKINVYFLGGKKYGPENS